VHVRRHDTLRRSAEGNGDDIVGAGLLSQIITMAAI
jgi:hypothetical protein